MLNHIQSNIRAKATNRNGDITNLEEATLAYLSEPRKNKYSTSSPLSGFNIDGVIYDIDIATQKEYIVAAVNVKAPVVSLNKNKGNMESAGLSEFIRIRKEPLTKKSSILYVNYIPNQDVVVTDGKIKSVNKTIPLNYDLSLFKDELIGRVYMVNFSFDYINPEEFIGEDVKSFYSNINITNLTKEIIKL